MNNLESLLVFLMIGLIAGWLAGVLFKGSGFGTLGDIIIGVIGAEIGGWIFDRLGFAVYGIGGAILTAVVGAVALLVVIKLVRNLGASKSTPLSLLIALSLLASFKAQAATTVTVDDNNRVTITQPAVVPAAEAPVVVTQEAAGRNFEGRITQIDYSRYQILVQDSEGGSREAAVKPETINSYRIGDYVQVRPTADLTIVTLQENPKDFEGEIIRVDMSRSQIVVQDTAGRQRRVQLKQGMIGTYKVDDYVRVHLMADLKEAKTVETVGDMHNLEGNIVNIDYPQSRMVIREANGRDTTVLVRQGMINNYRVGDHARIYLLANHEDVQLVRVVR